VAPDVATVFRFVTFEGNAYFLRTAFCGRTSLERVIFYKDANFTDATFQNYQALGRPGFSLSYVNVMTLRLKWSQLPSPGSWVQNSQPPEKRIQSFLKGKEAGGEPLEPLSEVLKSLEANFRRQNQLGDANDAYYHLKRAELQEAREDLSFWQRLPLEAEWLLLGILCGYGTGFWTVVSWTLGFNVLFSLIYWTTGDLQRHRAPEIARDFTFKWRLWDFPHVYITPKESSAEQQNATNTELLTEKAPTSDAARKFWDALRFSSGILFKLGYRDTTVSSCIGKYDLRWIVAVEWVLGFYLLALLIYTLTNTQPLLNKLIQGVF
jgi:hypothetical protein